MQTSLCSVAYRNSPLWTQKLGISTSEVQICKLRRGVLELLVCSYEPSAVLWRLRGSSSTNLLSLMKWKMMGRINVLINIRRFVFRWVSVVSSAAESCYLYSQSVTSTETVRELRTSLVFSRIYDMCGTHPHVYWTCKAGSVVWLNLHARLLTCFLIFIFQ